MSKVASGPSRPATLVGVQNGIQIYNQTLMINDGVGDGGSTAAFPSYLPMATGTITWTVTIADDDPDVDTATRRPR